MQIKSLLGRLNPADLIKPAPARDADTPSPALDDKHPPLEKSEITALFEAAFEEMQNDLPLSGRQEPLTRSNMPEREVRS